ncbi:MULTISPECIES: hypothetical protein [unclassified Amycolatopsis]|uniref:hypothetical protein n=1 Tax=unclassified Amycolatopsis TaxID=2618356 RepID=UPI001A904C52|nr:MULTISPECIES: hypothetical protein [unclassified Amycolatopsis]HET6707158.1 hypothetical protein [Amycolatopsis sp.]
MNSVESFVNVGDSLQPLEMVVGAAPVSCFWAAFNGAGAAFIANWAVQKGVDYYRAHHNGGSFAEGEAPAVPGQASVLSGDDLVALRDGRF